MSEFGAIGVSIWSSYAINAMTYYQHVRREIQPLLPKKVDRILDVGAGVGATLGWLKTIYPNAETTGVELNPVLWTELKRNVDVAIIGNIEECTGNLRTYDLILLLDVLEHLVDSIGALRKLSKLLEPQGHIIVSLPNIAHLSVAGPLLLKRRFAYRDAGILDRTHLRFFVEETAIKLLNDSDLIVTDGLLSGLQGNKAKLLDRLSFGLLRHHLTKQYIMLATMNWDSVVQKNVHWKVAQKGLP